MFELPYFQADGDRYILYFQFNFPCPAFSFATLRRHFHLLLEGVHHN